MREANFNLRAFSEADAQQVHDVAFEAWRFTYRDIFPIEYITNFVNVNYAPEQLKWLAGGAAVGTLFFDVVEYRSRVIGFCHIGPSRQGMELFRTYLLPEHISQGIGGELLRRGETFLLEQGRCSYFCFVHRANKIGKRFYQKRGFRHLADRDENDEWYMEKNI